MAELRNQIDDQTKAELAELVEASRLPVGQVLAQIIATTHIRFKASGLPGLLGWQAALLGGAMQGGVAIGPSNPGKSKAASQPKETAAERKERTAREEAERKAKRIPWGRECNRIMEYAELPDHIRPRVRFNPQYEYEVAEGGHKYRQLRFDVIDPNDQEASDWLVRRHRHPNATTAGHPYPTQLDHLSAGELMARFGVTPENKREIPLDLLKVDGGYGRPTCTWTPIELPDPVRFGLDARASIELATNEYRREPTVVEGWRTFKAVRVTREPAPGEDYVSYDTFLAQHGPYPESEAFEAAHGAPHFPGENG